MTVVCFPSVTLAVVLFLSVYSLVPLFSWSFALTNAMHTHLNQQA